MNNLINELSALIPDNLLSTNQATIAYHSLDWRKRIKADALAVVYPTSTTMLSQVIKLCVKHQVAIVPQGGNTSLCGSSVPNQEISQPQIIVNLSKLNHIIEFDPLSATISVEAGCILLEVQNYVKSKGWYFPLDIAAKASCQIGGNIATNCGGVHVIKYGTMRNLVLGLEIVLPNGEIVNQMYKLYKNNTNFDLKQLFIGSEGTLGIITKAVLRIYPQINNYLTSLVEVNSVKQTLQLLNLLKSRCIVSAYEIINDKVQELCNNAFKDNSFPLSAPWLVLLELENCDDLDFFMQICDEIGINPSAIIVANSESERCALWEMRERIPLVERSYGVAVKHDISIPQNQIESFIEQNQVAIHKTYPDAEIIIFGHLGDGNLHYNIVNNKLESNSFPEFEKLINRIVYADVTNCGGSISAEHGIGVLKRNWFKQYVDPNSYKLMQQIKQLLDPLNIFNPGKLFV